MFSCEIFKKFKSIYFYSTSPMPASENIVLQKIIPGFSFVPHWLKTCSKRIFVFFDLIQLISLCFFVFFFCLTCLIVVSFTC